MTGADMRAGRFRRLVAAGIDLVVTAIIAFALMWPLGLFEHEQAYESVQFVMRLLGLMLGSYVLLHGWLLRRRGQTLGKLLLRIRVVSQRDSEQMPAGALLVRVFWVLVLAAILALALPPMVALGLLGLMLVGDALFIFSPGRRCLHDYLVGSQVERVSPKTSPSP